MPTKKQSRPSPLPPEALEFAAARFRILSDPTRLAVLHALQGGELTVGAIVKRTRGDQSNVSKHLGLLATAGMVSRRRDGNFAFYSISDPVVFKLCELVCHQPA
jgi:DNA-binding transcriptional ArsR family regulator